MATTGRVMTKEYKIGFVIGVLQGIMCLHPEFNETILDAIEHLESLIEEGERDE